MARLVRATPQSTASLHRRAPEETSYAWRSVRLFARKRPCETPSQTPVLRTRWTKSIALPRQIPPENILRFRHPNWTVKDETRQSTPCPTGVDFCHPPRCKMPRHLSNWTEEVLGEGQGADSQCLALVGS